MASARATSLLLRTTSIMTPASLGCSLELRGSWTAEIGEEMVAKEREARVLSFCLFRLFVKFVLEAPCLTPSALEIIKSYCREEVCVICTCVLVIVM